MHIMETLYNISPILKYNRIENNSNENVFIVFIMLIVRAFCQILLDFHKSIWIFNSVKFQLNVSWEYLLWRERFFLRTNPFRLMFCLNNTAPPLFSREILQFYYFLDFLFWPKSNMATGKLFFNKRIIINSFIAMPSVGIFVD